MIDVGSGEGFNLVLQAAEFGGNAPNVRSAEALVALSSAGDQMFEEGLKHARPSRSVHNAWLSVAIAEPPLVLMYKTPADKTEANGLPLVRSYSIGSYNYHYVSCSDLANFYASWKESVGAPAVNYLTTGTRKNIDEACGWGANSPKSKPNSVSPANISSEQQRPVHFLEDLAASHHYADLRSWVPMSSLSEKAATCGELHESELRLAGICSTCDGPTDLKRAEFVVVVKLRREPKGDRYRIATEPACKLASALTDIIHSCEIRTVDASWTATDTGYELARISSKEVGNQEIPHHMNCSETP
jgi:hypothetical protein